jgi:uncharacterized protein YegP (UPF0339 family)
VKIEVKKSHGWWNWHLIANNNVEIQKSKPYQRRIDCLKIARQISEGNVQLVDA